MLRIPLVLGSVFYCLVLLYANYFVLFPIERASGWDYGWDQVASYIKAHQDENILVDDTRNPRAYILLLYYLKVPPVDYQSQVNPYYKNYYYAAPPPAEQYTFSKVTVRKLVWERDPIQNLTIIGDPLTISRPQAAEHGLDEVSQITGPDGNPIFNIYKTTPSLK